MSVGSDWIWREPDKIQVCLNCIFEGFAKQVHATPTARGQPDASKPIQCYRLVPSGTLALQPSTAAVVLKTIGRQLLTPKSLGIRAAYQYLHQLLPSLRREMRSRLAAAQSVEIRRDRPA